ncbi:MAG: response regulator transcription factor [Chitinophagales bacterium]|nr:response regulator transcription factor [Chitinophagales bacterium]MDW8427378.1 response regulator transcription factor [Chitinophagales bacterium]
MAEEPHSPLRICIFDDSELRCEALTLLLEAEGRFVVVGAYGNCAQVVTLMEQLRPDVVLMDIEMPHPDGLTGLRLIKKHFPHIKVIMQTIHEEDENIFMAVCYGADGYILKKTLPEQLLEAIFEVLQGGAPMSPYIARRIMKMLSGEVRVIVPDFNLTKRECEILELLAKGQTYKEVAERLHISYNTVNAHVRNIYEKLQVHSIAEAIDRLRQLGRR